MSTASCIAGLWLLNARLQPGGLLAVVTFHSVEDRMVKRFLQSRAGTTGRANRFAPELDDREAAFELLSRKAIGRDEMNCRKPRAHVRPSCASRGAPMHHAGDIAPKTLGMPMLRRDR